MVARDTEVLVERSDTPPAPAAVGYPTHAGANDGKSATGAALRATTPAHVYEAAPADVQGAVQHWHIPSTCAALIAEGAASGGITPAQFDPIAAHTPEQALLLALLFDALELARGGTGGGIRPEQRTPRQNDALRWFRSSSRQYGAFLFVCEHLNVAPDAIRRAVVTGTVRRIAHNRTAGSRTTLQLANAERAA